MPATRTFSKPVVSALETDKIIGIRAGDDSHGGYLCTREVIESTPHCRDDDSR